MSAVLAVIDRTEVAAYLNALLLVYSIIIVVHVLGQMIFSLGGRVPYSRWSDAILGFLRDVSEPYLGLFRRFLPMLGPVDISPIVGLLVLYLVGGLVVRAIHG
ncbi:MAG TPA: YggT family protein [Solirubrobacteraceae bacterium]|nr:YggT family protein [Solirubrobacteraceae bacterium]